MLKRSYNDSEQRRKLGELVTYPYNLFIRNKDKKQDVQVTDIVDNKGKRQDDRSCNDHRKIFMKCGVVEDARGSAYVEIGGTKVIASANGPVEMPQSFESEEKGFLNCEVKFSQFSCKSRDEEEELGTEIETVTDGLNRALEPAVIKEELGNVQLNIVVTVVESDGSITSACVIAASLAIANGRIPMCDLVSSATMALLPGGINIIDPTACEEEFALMQLKTKESHGVINLSYMSSTDQVTDFVLSGKLEVESVLPALPQLKEQCCQIYGKMQQLLKKDIQLISDVIISRNNKQSEEETSSAIRDELAKLSTK